MLTAPQILAIILVLQAFGVDNATLHNVEGILDRQAPTEIAQGATEAPAPDFSIATSTEPTQVDVPAIIQAPSVFLEVDNRSKLTTLGGNCGQVRLSVVATDGMGRLIDTLVSFTNPESGVTTMIPTEFGIAGYTYIPKNSNATETVHYSVDGVSGDAQATILGTELELLPDTNFHVQDGVLVSDASGRKISRETGMCL